MAQDTTPALILYVGDGSQTRFEVPFDKGAYGEIKVAFVRRGLTDYTYNPDTYTVDGATVGSTGTQTQAFQLLKDNKITFTNGKKWRSYR